MRFPHPILRSVAINISAIAIACTAALSMACMGLFGARLLTVPDSGLAPTLSQGDAVIIEKIPANNLGQDDVVSYYQSASSAATHEGRAVFVSPSQQSITVANGTGTLTKISDAAIAGRVNVRLSHLGYAITFLQTIPGLVVGLYLPATVIVGFELKRLLAYYDRLVYRLPGYANH